MGRKIKRGSEYIMLVVHLLIRHAELYSVSEGKINALGLVEKLVNIYIPRLGCPHIMLSDRCPEFMGKMAKAVYKMLGGRNDWLARIIRRRMGWSRY